MISIVICTYNRANLLHKNLQSLLEQQSSDAYEIIVVDNNSSEDTPRLVRSIQKETVIPIKYIFEPRQGLSYARNTGMDAATGDIIAFIDDDAVADAHWLQAVSTAFRNHEQIMVAGGPVTPIWDGKKPSWISGDLYDLFGVFDYGDTEKEMQGKAYPVGGNCAIKRSILDTEIRFNINLGHVGYNLLSGEETELFERIRSQGGILLFVPDMLIKHYIPKERMTKTYVKTRRYWQGRSLAISDRLIGNKKVMIRNLVLHIILMFAQDIPSYAFFILSGKPDRAFISKCHILRVKGYLVQSFVELKKVNEK